MKRVFIIHGWDGRPYHGSFPWLKTALEKEEFVVCAPAMPDPLYPEIGTWVSFLAEQVGIPDEHTFFFGHSIGCQTILRFLETLPDGAPVGGAVLLAPWVHLTNEAYEDEEDVVIARPWIETELIWDKIKSHSKKFTAIFSDNDPLVPLTDSKIFEEKLGAQIILEHNENHFSDTKELPSALKAVLELEK